MRAMPLYVRIHVCAAVKLHTYMYVNVLLSSTNKEATTETEVKGVDSVSSPAPHIVSDMCRYAQVCDLGLFNRGRWGGMNPPLTSAPDLSGPTGPCLLTQCVSRGPSTALRAAKGPISACEALRSALRSMRGDRWSPHMWWELRF